MSHWERCFPAIGWSSRLCSCVCCCRCHLPTAVVWNAHRGKCARIDLLWFSVSWFITAHPLCWNVLLLFCTWHTVVYLSHDELSYGLGPENLMSCLTRQHYRCQGRQLRSSDASKLWWSKCCLDSVCMNIRFWDKTIVTCNMMYGSTVLISYPCILYYYIGCLISECVYLVCGGLTRSCLWWFNTSWKVSIFY